MIIAYFNNSFGKRAKFKSFESKQNKQTIINRYFHRNIETQKLVPEISY